MVPAKEKFNVKLFGGGTIPLDPDAVIDVVPTSEPGRVVALMNDGTRHNLLDETVVTPIRGQVGAVVPMDTKARLFNAKTE
jgi:hypothetical protein